VFRVRRHHGQSQALVHRVSHRRKHGKPKKFRRELKKAQLLLGNLAQVLDACDRNGVQVKLHHGIVFSKYGYVLPLRNGWSVRTLELHPLGDMNMNDEKASLMALPAAED
jgi:hypothetical protein